MRYLRGPRSRRRAARQKHDAVHRRAESVRHQALHLGDVPDFAGSAARMEFYSALSGVEHALWDIVGKAAASRSTTCWAGRVATRSGSTPTAGPSGGDPHEAAAQRARSWSKGSRRSSGIRSRTRGARYIDKDQENRPSRACGPCARRSGRTSTSGRGAPSAGARLNAIRVANAIEEYGPYWFEEPSTRNLDAWPRSAPRTSLPIVTGEELYTKTEFRECCSSGGPRTSSIRTSAIVGGILELKEIAAMAEPYAWRCRRTTTGASVGLAATSRRQRRCRIS